jgi:hypothetical protein
VAAFVKGPVKEPSVTPLTVTVTTPPGRRGPKEHVMAELAIEQVPWLGVTEVGV